METATATLNTARAGYLTGIHDLRGQLGMWHFEDLTEKKGHATTWLPNRREQEHIQTLVGCDKLRDVVGLKGMI